VVTLPRGAAAALLAALLPACSARTAGLADARLLDLAGAEVAPLDALRSGGAKAAVFLFTSVECPISNRYAPEMTRLFDEYSPLGVAFALVFCDPAETSERVRAHVAEFALPMRALRDPRHELVRAAGATVTPEAVLVGADGAIAYRGRIDDRFVDFGETRPAPTRRDLRDAIEALLAGKPVAARETPAVGCAIAERP